MTVVTGKVKSVMINGVEMMPDRDKFLTEAMEECWHEYEFISWEKHDQCACGKQFDCLNPNNNFSTWSGFGKLWQWSQKQEWWGSFRQLTMCQSYEDELEQYIHPDRFADAVYKYLKERK